MTHSRAGSRALMMVAVVMALCVSSASAFQDMIAINGPSYIWQMATSVAATKTTLIAAFGSDFTAAMGSAGTITVQDLVVNATAMFVSYTVTGAATPSETTTLLMASKLPQVNSAMDAVKQEAAFSNFADMFPASFHPIVPLLPWPDNIPTPAPEITGSGSSSQTILFSGTPATWTLAMKSKRSEIETAVCATSLAAISRPLFEVTCKVKSLSVQQAGSLKELGDGTGGLVATIAVKQSAEKLAQHMYDPQEVSSLLMDMDTTEVDAIYKQFTNEPTEGVITVRQANVDFGFQCTSGCKGMIAMGSIIGAIMIFVMVLLFIIICCPCGPFNTKNAEAIAAKVQV